MDEQQEDKSVTLNDTKEKRRKPKRKKQKAERDHQTAWRLPDVASPPAVVYSTIAVEGTRGRELEEWGNEDGLHTEEPGGEAQREVLARWVGVRGGAVARAPEGKVW